MNQNIDIWLNLHVRASVSQFNVGTEVCINASWAYGRFEHANYAYVAY